MGAPQIIQEFFEWRWAPCVGLTAGSLMFVGLAVLIIPSQLQESAHPGTERAAAFSSPAVLSNTAFEASLSQSPFASSPTVREPMHHPFQPPPANEPAPRRGFSPPIERPEAPPPPVQPPPARQTAPPAAVNPQPPEPPPEQAAPAPAPEENPAPAP